MIVKLDYAVKCILSTQAVLDQIASNDHSGSSVSSKAVEINRLEVYETVFDNNKNPADMVGRIGVHIRNRHSHVGDLTPHLACFILKEGVIRDEAMLAILRQINKRFDPAFQEGKQLPADLFLIS